jgi:hypothetical protein
MILLLAFTSINSHSKAFCALRDPVAQIYQLYPQADSYRSIVRTIDENTRQKAMKLLPGQQLHIDELGRHTLYVAMKKEQPIGIVHVRSEQSRWGLIEIAWALDLNLTVIDFDFQRSRALGQQIVKQQSFKQLLIGKNFAQLSEYIDQQGNLINPQFNFQAQKAPELAKVVLVNALKTLLVTQLAWSQELQQLKGE